MNTLKQRKKLKSLFYVIVLVTILGIFFRSWLYSENVKERIYIDAKKEAHLLRDYMMSMRAVYHKQFLDSGIELNDNTIGFLPAHASTLISDKFMKSNKNGFYIRNVSDNPRNPKNLADTSEMEAINYFNKYSDLKEYVKVEKSFIQFAYPIHTKAYCLACHGKKENVIPSIRKNYDTAYGYKVGDLRGVVSIKIPSDQIDEIIFEYIKEDILISAAILIFITGIMFTLFRKVLIHVHNIEENAEKISLKDKLTNTYNRHFLEDFNHHHEYFNDENQKFAVAFIDIDHFKKINDTYGHDVGDEILKTFANQLLASTRSTDIVIRYGGEEFLVLTYNINLEKAINKFEEIRKSIENTKIEYNGGSLHITVSIGVHTGNYEDNIKDVISQADQAVYKAKNTGRNKTCSTA
jgi:diguanylate cyclase (GGDEF)-like protein